MALDLRLQQKLSQQLVMTPQLQQAIKLLQLSHLELQEAIQEELDQNPVLEEGAGLDGEEAANDSAILGETPEGQAESSGGEDGVIAQDMMAATTEPGATAEPSAQEIDRDIDWDSYLESQSYSLPATAGAGSNDDLPPFEATLSKAESLHDHLRWQIQMWDFSDLERSIALMLTEEINDDGYLAEDAVQLVVDELDVSAAEVEAVISELQTFDPVGVGSRNLKECLLVQARHMAIDNPLVLSIIEEHLPAVERRNLPQVAKALGVELEQVVEAVRVITHLEPRPGRNFVDREPQYISPDIYVHKVGDDYVIVLNEDGLPRLKISNYYRGALQSAGDAKGYIQEKLRSAAWLIRSIHMRQRTIYRVMESILKFQREFFDKGANNLKPLILRDVAEDLEMHESTISRVTTNKYVHTPQGIFELKYFFNSSINRVGGEAIASESVRNLIGELIAGENPEAPLSDQALVEHLRSHKIDIARRTVAKYREMLKIPPSSKRRRMY